MNDKERVRNILDREPSRHLRICRAESGCACLGCANVTPRQLREYLFDKIMAVDLVIKEDEAKRLQGLKNRLDERKNKNL